MDFNEKTSELLKTAKHGQIGIREFDRLFSPITDQIRQDAGAPWLQLWGMSRNFDEYEKQKIVDPKILTTIGRIARIPIRNKDAYHAGLMHTYGYLFSQLMTRFGYKRERWTKDGIEKRIGLKSRFLSPFPPSGTLLRNVSYLLTRIALPQLANRFAEYDVDPGLTEFPFDGLKRIRIVERFKPKTSAKSTQIMTDLVQYHRATAADAALLVYSYQLNGEPRLVSCFPVSRKFQDEMLSVAKSNEIPIVARFNAVIRGIPQKGIMGTRRVEKNF